MRDVYYQSAGNPLQIDRLPATRPEIELLAPLPGLGDTVRQLGRFLLWLGAALLVTLFIVPPGLKLLEPFDLVLALPVIGGTLMAALFTRRIGWLHHPVFLAALVVACLNHRTGFALQATILAIVSGFLVYSFGRHWSIVCTASPLPREVARRLRTLWAAQLATAGALAALLIAAWLLRQSTLAAVALAVLPLAVFVAPARGVNGSKRLAIVASALRSWLIYDPAPVPGLAQSSAGNATHRRLATIAVILIAMMTMLRWDVLDHSTTAANKSQWLPAVIAQHVAGAQSPIATATDRMFAWTVALLAIVGIPTCSVLAVIVCFGMPVLIDGAAERTPGLTPEHHATLVADLRRSSDATERESTFIGRVVADGSPVLVHRSIYREHAHFLGDSGSGKTSQGLCPQIEQLTRDGDCSLVCIDLKADSLELLAALRAAAERVREERGITMPLKFFSNQTGRATFVFNPMMQPFWQGLDLMTRTDILCGALGLTYGTDYGQGFYSSANAGVLFFTLKTFPHVKSFAELEHAIGTVLATARKRDLHPEIRKAGVHVHEVIKRLAACEAINAQPGGDYPPEVVDQAIDLTSLFREPQLLYFHLSATLSPSGAPEIGRLVNYLLLAASTQVERRHPVYLVIDEFQRMVANNIEYMLQLARSMGVGVILANQSMEDLRTSTIDLVPAIEANCRFRQWFSVSASNDQQRLIEASGETIDYLTTRSKSTNSNGGTSTSVSVQEHVVKRLTMNDVLLTSDHPFRSIVRISRGAGYAQYGGLPFIVESTYHISTDEYLRRKAIQWPSNVSGTFVPQVQLLIDDALTTRPTQPTSHGPTWTEEVVGGEDTSSDDTGSNTSSDDPFDSLFRSLQDLGPTDQPQINEDDNEEDDTHSRGRRP